ncbi:hypothetical protein K435DRAFT_805012 [Dendrothele bispora CBS 962.96]|uniref:Uncharacterized protein n=1 Tax=Dendrothele bispora (strain CBS 962.96) TaxID=1314807 RepID=A0A4V4HDB7_DENBC|nr:hypothetical protein K435DRAFT_805012 [Dendrothele bispora CBS 962.96]
MVHFIGLSSNYSRASTPVVLSSVEALTSFDTWLGLRILDALISLTKECTVFEWRPGNGNSTVVRKGWEKNRIFPKKLNRQHVTADWRVKDIDWVQVRAFPERCVPKEERAREGEARGRTSIHSNVIYQENFWMLYRQKSIMALSLDRDYDDDVERIKSTKKRGLEFRACGAMKVF